MLRCIGKGETDFGGYRKTGKCFFASDRSVPALSGGLDRGRVVVVGAYLGLGTVYEWMLGTSANVTERRLVRNLRFLHLHPFPRMHNPTLLISLTDKSPKIRAWLKRLEQSRRTGRPKYHIILLRALHTLSANDGLSNHAGRNISPCKHEVDVGLSGS
jgi:hypothetical protein